jgi:RHS repeat-associated protein
MSVFQTARSSKKNNDQKSRRRGRGVVGSVVAVLIGATALQTTPVLTGTAEASTTAAPQLTQSGYVFENDSSATGVDGSSQQAAGNTALTGVRQGERLTLRTQLTNSGAALASSRHLGVFYDRGDNIWTQVRNGAAPPSGGGTCADTNFVCASIETAGTIGNYSSSAIAPDGTMWVSYYDQTNANLKIAKYVGSGGTGCAAADWTCTTVDSTGTVGEHTSLAIDSTGTPWISYYDGSNANLKVAKFVNTGGTGCATTAWTCTIVESTNDVGRYGAIAFDTSNVPYISYVKSTGNDLKVAKLVNTGGTGCATTAWTCTTIAGAPTIDYETSIAAGPAGKMWVAYTESNNGDLFVATNVASGGNCASGAWSCTQVDHDGSVGYFSSIAVGPDGIPWVSYLQDSMGQLKVAHQVSGSGTGCSTSTWTCDVIQGAEWVGNRTSLAFDPAGNPWIAWRNDGAQSLYLSRYVGSGGTGCALTSWKCAVLSDGSNDMGVHPSLYFRPDGTAIVTYQDAEWGDLDWARLNVGGEIASAPLTSGANGAAITQSHADTTSVTDSVNRTDADCRQAGATWNNGKWFNTDDGTGLTIAAGTTTAQCTEVAFGLDTTNAKANQNYRFLIATDDPWQADNGKWRGPIGISANAYASITTASSTPARYSKQVVTSLPTTTAELSTHFDAGSTPRTAATPCSSGYCAVELVDAATDSVTAAASQLPVVLYAPSSSSNTSALGVSWSGTSSVAPSSKAITVQAYRFGTTNAWETITPTSNTCSTAGANTTCAIGGSASGPAAQYYQANGSGGYTSYLRVYQAANTAAETLSTNRLANIAPVVNQAPTATFTYSPAGPVAGTSVSFNGSGSTDPDSTIASYAWNFGDSTSGTGSTTTHTYAAAGTYTATLTVTDNQGATNSFPRTITVTAAATPPTASFTATTTNGTSPLGVAVNGGGSTAVSPATLTNWNWDWGDSTSSSGVASTTHVYSAPGTYTITLTVTDSNAQTATTTRSATVYAAPTASFTATPTSGNSPLSVAFNASASTSPSGGTITGYSWVFGDGTSATGATTSHIYTGPGTFAATLVVTDSRNNIASTTRTVTVNETPVANIVVPTSTGSDPLTVNFDASTSTTLPGATISKYEWDFGDGYTASGAAANHTYGAGSFTAILTITDTAGRVATDTQAISSTTSTYAQAVLADNPVRYYRFGETSGTTAVDSSPSGVNGTYTGYAALGATGALSGDTNKAVDANAATNGNAVVTAPVAGLPAGNSARTVEGWFKSTGRYQHMAGYSGFAITVEQFGTLTLSTGIDSLGASVPYSVEDGNWHHTAATFDGTTARLYLDGVAVGSKPMTLSATPTGTTTISTTYGTSDEHAIYNTALSPARIAAHWTKAQTPALGCIAKPTSPYAASILEDKPAAYYRLGEGIGDGRVAYDSSGNCLNGERGIGTSTGAAGALASDVNTSTTTTSQDLMTASAAPLPSGNAPRTIEGWLKSTGRYYTAIGYGDFSITDEQFGILTVNWPGGNLQGPMPFSIEDDNWHHVAATHDGTTVSLYFDGQAIGREAVTLATPVDGKKLWSNVGNADELAVYPTALSDAQILEHWTRGASSSEACAAAPNSAYSTIVKADKPVSYYRLGDAGSSRVAYDSSGNCNNGTYTPGIVPSAGALGGDANPASAGGAGWLMTAPAGPLPSGNAPRSIEVWFNSTSRYYQPVGYNDFSFSDEQFGYMTLHAGDQHFGVNNIEDGNWHHLVGTYDGTVARLFLDGELKESRTPTGGLHSSTANSPLQSGIPGSVDELAVYDKALPEDTVLLHYVGGKYAGLISDAINIRELLASGNSCYGCLAQAIMGAAHGLHADPIDTTFGVFSETVGDLSIEGRGLPLVQMRSYSSAMAGDNGPFGYGWKGGYNAKLVVDPDTGDVMISQENGAEVRFIEDTGTYTPSAPRFIADLTHNSNGTWTLVRNHLETLVFNSDGNLISQSDRNGATTTLTYNAGKLNTVTNAEGRSFTYTWTGSRITKVTDSGSREVNYTYNGNGELTKVVGADGATWNYTYDSNHRLLTQLDPNQDGSSTPHPVTNVYDTQGRVTSQTNQLDETTTFVYNTDGSVLVTDPEGHQSLDIYQNHLRVAVVNGYGTPQATITHFAYDPRTASLVASYTEAPDDGNDHSTFATYDDDGNMLTSTDGVGRTSSYTYDSMGNVLTATTPNPSDVGPDNVTTTNTYDTYGNLLTTMSPLYTSETVFTNQTVTYARNESGKPDLVSTITDPLNKVTTMSYDSIGQLQSTTSPEGRKTTYTYDNLGRTKTVVAPKGNVVGATAANFTTTYNYDPVGRVLSTSTANGSTPINSTSVYDDNGNLTSTTDGDSRTTTFVYDRMSQQTEVHRPGNTVLKTNYYDNGVLHQQVDGANKATTYGQDALGRIVSSQDPNNRSTTFTYDGVGSVLSTTDSLGRVTSNSYDNSGALTATNYSDPATPDVTIAYGAAGQRTAMTDGSGTQTWTYDSLGRVTGHTNGANKTVEYEYSIRGELTTIDYPNNGDVIRTYDDDGTLASVKDWNNNTTSFDYDQDGQLTTTNYANGVIGTNTYDNPGRLNAIAYTKGATNLATFNYTRTTGGDVSAESNSGTSSGSNKTYTYSTLGQLGTENGTGFSYDAADNLTSVNGKVQTYDYANQLLGSGNKTFTYDAQGNRTSQTAGSSATTLVYDQANRLKSYGTTATYQYDGGGLRTSKTVSSTTSSFAYDTVQGLPLIIDDGTNAYIYGPGGMVISQITGSTTTYLHQDQLGSTRLLTNSSGSAAGTYQFDAYGNTTSHTGTNTPMQYAGQYADTESSLYWMRARYYDPSTGQFLTRDPLLSVTRSAYGYVAGDPLNGTDPSGLIFGGLKKAATSIAKGAGNLAVKYSGDIATGTGLLATGLAFVPGTQGLSLALGAVSLGFSFVSAYDNARKGDTVGLALDVAGIVPGVGATAKSFQAASKCGHLKFALSKLESYGGKSTNDVLRLSDAATALRNEQRVITGWGDALGFVSNSIGITSTIRDHA